MHRREVVSLQPCAHSDVVADNDERLLRPGGGALIGSEETDAGGGDEQPAQQCAPAGQG